MLTNIQFQYIAYGVMIMVVFILVINVFITKVSNNYDNNTFETFGNIREGLTNAEQTKEDAQAAKDIESMEKTANENINKWITEMCQIYNPNSTADMINELAKMKVIYGITASDMLYSYLTLPAKDQDSEQGWASSSSMERIIKNINTIDVIISSLKEYKFDCNSLVNISKLKSTKGNLESNIKHDFSKGVSKVKSWF